jgi:HEAT repeat protein
MRTRLVGNTTAGRTGKAGSAGCFVLLFSAVLVAQVPYDEAIGGLASKDVRVRLHSATLLKESAYVESAIPLAKLLSDPDNAVQLEAIAAEVNIFTAGKGGPKRVGIITIEDRTRPAGQQIFDAGPLVLAAAPVPTGVLIALRLATRDDSPKVSIEALYAFGALGSQLTGRPRRDLLQGSLADLAALLSVQDPALRLAGLRVIGRLYARRAGDAPIDQMLGNLVIAAVNENDREMKLAAMDTLGALRERRAVDGLTQLFQFYGKGDLAEAALAALSRIGDRSSAPLFLTQLSGKPTPMKVIAIEGLARIGDASHMAAIQSALKHEGDERVIAASNFAAAMLSNAPIEQLVDALNRPKSHDVVRQYLVEIAPGRVTRMSRYAQDPAPRMRIDVADIVGLADDPQGVRVVAPLLTDMDKQVAVAAERATRRLQTDR